MCPDKPPTNEEGFIEWLKCVADKWSRKWFEERVYEPEPFQGPKFFVTAAFMYPNGPAHAGHARTYVVADVLARFKRLVGYNVLFPMGFHYTGTPILTAAERIASGDEDYIRKLAQSFGVDPEIIRSLNEPLKLARYFHRTSKEAMIRYGLSIDWSREFTTVDEEFKSFIRWQFSKLKEKGLLIKGSYPVGWCPRHSMPVGQHDTKDDVEPEIGEITIIKFLGEDGLIYPAATLRPETVLGVTNMWLNPGIEYCISEVDSLGRKERWVLSCDAAERLSHQREVMVVGKVMGEELIGRRVKNPVTGKDVRILPGTFVRADFGTGVVMSVPAHAPYDYAALRDYVKSEHGGVWPEELRPIPLIEVEGYGELPAKEVVESMGITSQEDREGLDKATKEVYMEEFKSGRMREDVANLVVDEVITRIREWIRSRVAGRPVSEAREVIKSVLIEHGLGDTMYEIMNAPVYCRCGTRIVVKLLHDQWFIDYGNREWKELAKKALSRMRIIPETGRNQILATIDWLGPKACARTRGLGTELPWQKGWVIESLSDSTIYMAFYTVIKRIREAGINPSRLGNPFWDYVMLGIGDPESVAREVRTSTDIVEKIRGEFLYWYPLDSRHSGKDLLPSHLTFFIFNHAAIYPEELWPRQIVANGWVLVAGEKMSKQKGNFRTLEGLIEAFSPDIVRLMMTLQAEVEQDFSMSDASAAYVDRLRRVWRLALSAVTKAGEVRKSFAERWLRARLSRHLKEVREELENVRVRAAGVRVLFNMVSDLEKYMELGGSGSAATEYVRELVKLISIYAPFFAEELWHRMGMKSSVTRERLSEPGSPDPEAELAIMYVDDLIKDIKAITRVVGPPRKVTIIVSDDERKWAIVRSVAKSLIQKLSKRDAIREVVKRAREAGMSPKSIVREVSKIYDRFGNLPRDLLTYIAQGGKVHEFEALSELMNYLRSKVGAEIAVLNASQAVGVPEQKVKAAMPLRPSIYIES